MIYSFEDIYLSSIIFLIVAIMFKEDEIESALRIMDEKQKRLYFIFLYFIESIISNLSLYKIIVRLISLFILKNLLP